MSTKKSHSTITTQRIETFSDGVFAIIMTLLILELKVPAILDTASAAEHLQALLELLPKFASFAMSFLVLAIFWVNHHSFLNSIEKADAKILWYNNHLLFWLCFIPFPTAWVGEHLHDTIAVALYGLTLFFAALAFQILVNHAYTKNLFKEHIDEKEQARRSKRSFPAIILYGMSIPLAFVNVYAALAIFILAPVLYFMPD